MLTPASASSITVPRFNQEILVPTPSEMNGRAGPVTGAAPGLGRATAIKLAAERAEKAFNENREMNL